MKKFLALSLSSVLLLSTLTGCVTTLERLLSAATEPTSSNTEPVSDEAKEYEKIYNILEEKYSEYWQYDEGDYVLYEEEGGMSSSATTGEDAAAPETALGADSAESNTSEEYSTTNVQEEGVDEADIVKTDGEYIYKLNYYTLEIVKADSGKVTSVSSTELDDSKNIFEMYLLENKLVLIYSEYIDDEEYLYSYRTDVGALVYDVTDRENPKEVYDFKQSGSYVSSRVTDGILYLITHKGDMMYSKVEQNNLMGYIPYFETDGESTLLPLSDIYINPEIKREETDADYTVISSFDISSNTKIATKSMMGYSGTVYCSTENLYVAGYTDLGNGSSYLDGTEIVRYSLNKGHFELEATGKVAGEIENQFSLSEKDGKLRLTTTQYAYNYIEEDDTYGEGLIVEDVSVDEFTNNLFILDEELNVIGEIRNLAPSERLYSTRFMGDMAYFVTFRETDPLFAADLSDPTNPVITGELKIPGFSEYLHPYGSGQLLGIGMNADEQGFTDFLKLSMFDISDPTNLIEKNIFITEEYYSEALYNHKAVLIDYDKNIIGFPGEQNFLICSYDETSGFTVESAIQFNSGGSTRALYIGEFIYIVGDTGIAIIEMNNYTLSDTYYFN